jgi:excisionase family DNA binding protein
MRGKPDQAVTSPVMTVAEVSSYLRIHRSTLYQLIRAAGMPFFRMGSDYRFNRHAIDEWRRAQEFQPALPSSRPRR